MALADIQREKSKWRKYVEEQLAMAGQGIILATDAELNDATSAINTDGRKETGLEVYNTTQDLPVWATGGAATDSWVSTSGGSVVVNNPIIANEVDAEIAATNPFLDFLADEASGNYFSQGSSALEIEIDPLFGNTEIWRQAPGVIRSTPIQYAFMHPTTQATSGWSNPTAGDANLPTAAGFTTGAMACFMCRFSTAKTPNGFNPMSLSYNNGGVSVGLGQAIRFEVNANGRLFFLMGTNQTNSVGSNRIRVQTGDGVIQLGEPYHIAAVQRADGNGIQLLVNGVAQAVTRQIGTSLNIDSWIDQWATATSNTVKQFFCVNGYANGVTTSYSYSENGPGLTQRPLVWRNNPPSDAQILDIVNGGLLNNPVSDYCEYLMENYVRTQDAWHLCLGWTNANEHNNWGIDVAAGGSSFHQRWQWGDTKQTENGSDPQRVSRWPLFRSQFFATGVGGQHVTTIGNTGLQSRTQGTVSFIVQQPASITIGQSQPLWVFGEGISGPDKNCGVFLAGNSFGTSVVFLIGEFTSNATTTGDFFRRTWAPADVGLGVGVFPDARYMLTIVQDGVDVKLYINGVEIANGVDSNSGTTYDESSWFNALGSLSAGPNISCGYPASTAHVDNLWVSENLVLQDRVLTAQEVLDHYNASLGTF